MAVKALQRIGKCFIQDVILIGLNAVRLSRMKIGRDFSGGTDADIIRQPLVQGVGELVRSHARLRIKNGNISRA